MPVVVEISSESSAEELQDAQRQDYSSDTVEDSSTEPDSPNCPWGAGQRLSDSLPGSSPDLDESGDRQSHQTRHQKRKGRTAPARRDTKLRQRVRALDRFRRRRQVPAGQAKGTPNAVGSLVANAPPPAPKCQRNASSTLLSTSLELVSTPRRCFKPRPNCCVLAQDTDTDDELFPSTALRRKKAAPPSEEDHPVQLGTSSSSSEELPDSIESEDADQEQDLSKRAIQKTIDEVKSLVQRAQSGKLAWEDAAAMILGVITNLILGVSCKGAGMLTATWLNTAAANALSAITASAHNLFLGPDPDLFSGHWKLCIESLEEAERFCF